MGKEINPIKSNPTLRRQKFDKAFKLNAIKLLQAGQKPTTQLALELGIRRNLLYKWAETLINQWGQTPLIISKHHATLACTLIQRVPHYHGTSSSLCVGWSSATHNYSRQ